MIKEIQLRVLPEVAASTEAIKQYAEREVGVSNITDLHILKRSIDARQRTIYVNLTVRLFINEPAPPTVFNTINYPDVSGKKQVIVVGAGPAGLFAALRLIELGLCPVVVERGKDVHERKKDIARISREQIVDPESNYCFGEGGAGAYSDGKLYTRSKKRGSVDRILNIFCQHGANPSILSDSHPHIGTDKLPRVIEAMRNQILQSGGEVHFKTCMEGLLLDNGTVKGIYTKDGKEFLGPVVLATGHSARDVYTWLHDNNVTMEAKGIAMGVRLEHPQQVIDQMQYHTKGVRSEYLPAAEYSFVTQANGRGVYSFCMCPGGFVVPAASAPNQLVVNGMSPSNRGSKWANSGIVVEIHPEDFPEYTQYSPLSLMHFQKDFEYQCYIQAAGKQTAPAQRMADFLNQKVSASLPVSSYAPGLISSPLHDWMPAFISSRLREGLQTFVKKSPQFYTNEAVLIGVESRTSSPVRILRSNETLQHIAVGGLFPCGEGAGYAGGIVSAAIDGERCAEAVASYLGATV